MCCAFNLSVCFCRRGPFLYEQVVALLESIVVEEDDDDKGDEDDDEYHGQRRDDGVGIGRPDVRQGHGTSVSPALRHVDAVGAEGLVGQDLAQLLLVDGCLHPIVPSGGAVQLWERFLVSGSGGQVIGSVVTGASFDPYSHQILFYQRNLQLS